MKRKKLTEQMVTDFMETAPIDVVLEFMDGAIAEAERRGTPEHVALMRAERERFAKQHAH